jgi:hypothetical protein
MRPSVDGNETIRMHELIEKDGARTPSPRGELSNELGDGIRRKLKHRRQTFIGVNTQNAMDRFVSESHIFTRQSHNMLKKEKGPRVLSTAMLRRHMGTDDSQND